MSSTTIHVGATIKQTVVGSDGPLAPGALAVGSPIPVICSCTVDQATNEVTLHGGTVGTVAISYAAAGHQPAVDNVTVIPQPPLPTLVITDGPET